ncbi:hypothetical protein L596_000733 [Steinernema carpocapsae]|uniref:Uncharacterized protein n=1 Tax=Steinernema carpocapsae TaxID=34508 RepID=A0A4U8ULC1_STECR|nr:hypothetical protein L596_000733 [Steinernema carpocapsae]
MAGTGPPQPTILDALISAAKKRKCPRIIEKLNNDVSHQHRPASQEPRREPRDLAPKSSEAPLKDKKRVPIPRRPDAGLPVYPEKKSRIRQPIRRSRCIAEKAQEKKTTIKSNLI